jgi:hypothetical protein
LLEFTTVEVQPAAASAFEAKLKAGQPSLKDETLWYRLVTGGQVPKYLRLRPRRRLSAVTEGADDQVLAQANSMITPYRRGAVACGAEPTIDVAGLGGIS